MAPLGVAAIVFAATTLVGSLGFFAVKVIALGETVASIQTQQRINTGEIATMRDDKEILTRLDEIITVVNGNST